MFDFGKQLKMLRTQKGLTQEQAAELLNVSKQSVSRWENNMTYPDVAFLPMLASFYGISVDTLLGVDYNSNKQIKDQYFDAHHAAAQRGDVRSAFELSGELYARFPNDTAVINIYMVDAHLMGVHSENEDRIRYLGIAIETGERLLKLTDDIEEQCRAIKVIAQSYHLLGNQAKAETWNAKLPCLWNSIEIASLDVFQGKKRLESAWCALEATISVMYRTIMALCEEATTVSEKRAVVEKIPALLELLFEDQDYGFYHVYLSRSYMKLAELTVEDADTAFAYICRAFDHAALADGTPVSPRSSVLFCGQTISRWAWTGVAQTYTDEMKQLLSSVIFESLHTDSRYQAFAE